MTLAVDSLPTDLAAAHAMIIAKHEALLAAEARASAAESEAEHRALLIEKLKYTIAKLRREKFGQSSERGAILEQLDSTTVIGPGQVARVDEWKSLIVTEDG